MSAVLDQSDIDKPSGAGAKSADSITRIDCYFWKVAGAEGSSYAALNPGRVPGSFAIAGACAPRQGIGSQVASKLALDYFVQGILEFFAESREISEEPTFAPDEEAPQFPPKEKSVLALEHAFKIANTNVYGFGHKLAAGGRLAASLAGLVVVDDVIGVGRVGMSGAYLCRLGEVFPFFEPRPFPPEESELLGTQSMVAVQLASVGVQERDVIFVSSAALTTAQERELVGVVGDLDLTDVESLALRAPHSHRNPCAQVVHALFGGTPPIDFAMLILVGPRAIYLAAPLS